MLCINIQVFSHVFNHRNYLSALVPLLCMPSALVPLLCMSSMLMQYRKAPEGSSRKFEAQKQFFEAMSHRMHIDHSIKLIGKLLFGIEKASEVLNAIRLAGQPLVDDWDCLKTLVKFYGSQPLLYHRLTCLFSLIASSAGDTLKDSFPFLRKCLLFFYAGEDF